MGSLSSAVAACLFSETLEQEKCMNIIPNDSKWYRYVDEYLLILHKDINISDILSRLKQVHPKIHLTVEHEVNGSLRFLDTVIIRENRSVKFKVYRKPTHKDDYVHYFSAHDKKTNTGVVMGFYPRALRICSPEFLNDELHHGTKIFEKLGFPAGLLSATLKKTESRKGEE
ncbi:uncharacterized protein LOC143019379 [Oratosquilla oratoria]|uniref:uncharacterized protein LOC143019379 n=1 Tax=Oratosquilla oratoria TaxID=337810 RepID=UPI003F762920